MRLSFALLLVGLASACEAQPTAAPAALPARAVAPPRFPPPSRPVSAIVSDRWSDEDSRERAGEAATVLRLASVAPGMRAADIGAGEGYYTLALSKAVGPRGTVIAQDIVPRYVAALERRVRRARAANVRVLLARADDPRLPAQSVDRAFLIHMYHEIAQPYALLWRLHASLKPGARVAIVDADRATDSHGTPPRLLACELAAVGYRQVGLHDLKDAGGYLALFEPLATRPEPAAIRPCA